VDDVRDTIEAARAGDRRALARLVSAVEDESPLGNAALAELFPVGGAAWTVGVTGAPGAGKSTIVDGFVAERRRTGSTIAIVAVDPSSPFTGGAILGDRVRMQRHTDDPGVYVRSMANRGHLGGIAESTPRALTVLAGLGWPEIIVETVGVGQAEVDVAAAVDTTVVVVNPGWGDAVQAAKAGILEIADIFVVNKADRPDTDRTVAELHGMLEVAPPTERIPPVLTAAAIDGTGIPALIQAVDEHRAWLVATGTLDVARRTHAAAALRSAVAGLLRASAAGGDADLVGRIARREIDPWSAARALVAEG